MQYKVLDLPGPEVGRVWVSIVQGQEVVLLLDGERQEHELDAAALLAHDHPGAVGAVGVAVGETRRLDTAVAALQRAATGVDEACRWEKERPLNQLVQSDNNLIIAMFS